MLSVKLINQLLRIPEILRRFPASPYVAVTRPLNQIMELLVVSFRVEDTVNFPFIGVGDHCRLRFLWRLAGVRSCIAVEPRDMENFVLRDRIRKV